MTETVKFIQFDKPAMESGLYQIEVDQSFKPKSGVEAQSKTTFKFAVEGERFKINPANIHAVFPPTENLGNYSDTLPHISFKNSTFPWERSAYNNDDFEPWIALLVFHEDEIESSAVKFGTTTLKNRSSKLPNVKEAYTVKFPAIKLGPGQKEGDSISVIDVQKSLLAKIVPTGADLRLLAHVRQRTDTSGKSPEDKLAVVVTNRLPRAGGRNTAHLVSVEGRYEATKNFNFESAADSDYIRLVSLHSWSFSCLAESNETLEELLKQVDSGTIGRRKMAHIRAGEPKSLKSYYDRGYVPVKHHIRQGSKTISWYRGPLVPQAPDTIQSLADSKEIRDSDALYRFNKTDGMFDVSYATAFELGRLMALDSKVFSKNLYNWKREQKQQKLSYIDASDYDSIRKRDLPISQVYAPTDVNDIDEVAMIRKWFDQLNLLKGVPFNYLVPNETLLPPESIRFFTLDRYWVDCLMRGAFSIGRVTKNDADAEIKLLHEVYKNDYANKTVSGFLLRSQIVSGWPSLIVEGYAAKYDNQKLLPTDAQPLKMLKPVDDMDAVAGSGNELAPARKQSIQRLSPDVMLCLFEGEVGTVELYEPPEALHFGLDEQDVTQGGKEVKTFIKDIQTGTQKVSVPVPITEASRVIKVSELCETIKTKLQKSEFTAAQFGRRMLEGEDKGRYVRS